MLKKVMGQFDYEKGNKMEDVIVIGVIRDKAHGCNLHLRSEQFVSMTAQGWVHFQSGE